MKTIFKTLAIGLLLTTVASCDKHDPFDENTFLTNYCLYLQKNLPLQPK